MLKLRDLRGADVLEFLLNLHGAREGNMALPPIPEYARLNEWWDPEYRLWVASWLTACVNQIRTKDSRGPTSFSARYSYTNAFNIVSHYGLNSVLRDRGGVGEVYIPNVFYLCWMLEATKHQDFARFASYFKELTSVEFRTFRDYVTNQPPKKYPVIKLYDEERTSNSLGK